MLAHKILKDDRVAVETVNDMMTGSMGSEWAEFRVGAAVPKALTPVSEGVRLGFDSSLGFVLMCTFSRPTDEEKRAFKSGKPQFGLVVKDGIIFFLSRFGTLAWMDTPFNRHLYHDNRMSLLKELGPTQGYGLHVMLIDGATGILVHQRLIGLDHELSMRLRKAIITQPVIPNYDQRLQLAMARYTTMDLVALSHSKEKADRAELMDEAVKRMKMLRMSPKYIEEFQNSGQLNFGMENGRIFPLNDSEKERIRKLEDNGEQLVYAVVRNNSDYGRIVNFITINIWLKPTWDLERAMVKDNRVMAYVYTSDFLRNPEEGAIDLPGGIVVKVLPGGILDRQDMFDE